MSSDFKQFPKDVITISINKGDTDMEICGKSNIKKKIFKDLKQGDVFYFIEDYSTDFSKINVYMRCGHTDENDAVNLETGVCYTFKEDLPVELLDTTLNVKF